MLEQLIQDALALHRAGRLAEAEPLYLKVLALDADFYPALHLMGLIRLHQGRPGEALPYIERALGLRPGIPDMLANYSIALDGVGRTPEALAVLEKVVKADPRNSRAWSNRGALLVRLNRHSDALADFDRALALDPAYADAWNNRGQVLMALSRFEEALESCDRLLQLKPDDSEARNNRGLALKALGRAGDALAEFERVIRERPDHAGAWVNRAAILRAMGEVDQALASYDRALALQPDMPEALASRANCRWTRKDDLAGAIADLEKLVSVRPDYPYARGDLLHLKMHAGDWRDFAAQRALLDDGVRAGRPVAEPYVYQGLSSSPADLLACAEIYTADKYPARPMPARRGRKPGRIRLGYLCGEFRAQATMYLAAGLFEHHDRGRFEVIAFDNSREDQSAMRRRAIAAFDKFIPIQSLPDREAARLIAAEEIDILVNLNGYFGALRMGVFAHRPAPIQVNYLGFPGSLGADYMDYIMADADVIPESDTQFFREKVITLPGSYQINDAQRPLPTPQSRADHGLKEKDFVFCHFNYAYKITPEMFATWLRLLASVPDSVLWLLESNPLFAGHVRDEAAKAGIDPARIVFAPRMENQAHISRLALGDLFLDSLPYNAHTTASDALWAGLPLLTCRGAAFAGRVAASLLKAVGLPELVTENLDDYERLALALAQDRARLGSYRHRLAGDRATLPLFDTARTTRHIEAAYQEMMARWTRGEKPAGFAVKAD
jgi:predicted O-linked N-acetylglucosamine transferase (SPINDLY family)